MERPENLCMAPWVHAMHDTNYVRSACCTADVPESLSERHAIKFKDFQNSEYMKNIRRQMMNNILPKECHRCNKDSDHLKNVNVFKDHWNTYYSHHYEEAMNSTAEDGATTFQPVYYDYRFGNTCNYKCRHCSPHASSSIEREEKLYNLDNPTKIVLDEDVRNQILYKELKEAADSRQLSAVQWIGGESLFSSYHWDFMTYLHEIKLFDVVVSYISNLSILEFKGKKLLDLLLPFNGVVIHASTESGGLAAEYIRRGMNWSAWTAKFLDIKRVFDEKSNGGYSHRIEAGLTINVFTLCGLRDWLKFVSDNQVRTCDITLVKAHHKNLYLGLESLGPYKQQWIDEFLKAVDEYQNRLPERTYNDLIAAVNLIRNLNTSIEKNNMIRSLHYAKTIDKIDQTPTTADVIKDWPFLQQWWQKLNEQYR